MIPIVEIKEVARTFGVPPSTIERDYAQNWLLTHLNTLPMALKGGDRNPESLHRELLFLGRSRLHPAGTVRKGDSAGRGKGRSIPCAKGEQHYRDEGEGFIAIVPELPGCSAFGKTEEEALSEVKVIVGLWLDTARTEDREIPEPSGREHLADTLAGKGVTREQMA